MAVTAKMFGQFLRHALLKEVNLSTDDIKVMLCTSALALDTTKQDSFEYKTSITNEVSGTGYTATGASLANKTLTYDSANNKIIFNADDITWANSTITARYAIIYDNTPSTDATKPLIAYLDFTTDQISSNGNFTIQWDNTENAIFTITTA
jgi:hypothetical protein